MFMKSRTAIVFAHLRARPNTVVLFKMPHNEALWSSPATRGPLREERLRENNGLFLLTPRYLHSCTKLPQVFQTLMHRNLSDPAPPFSSFISHAAQVWKPLSELDRKDLSHEALGFLENVLHQHSRRFYFTFKRCVCGGGWGGLIRNTPIEKLQKTR